MLFEDLGRRKVAVDFSGGDLSSDGGALLLRGVNASLGLSRRIAGCFEDHRDPRFVEHSMESLITQRIFGLALGYEDLNDHNELRRDPLFATAVGKGDPLGKGRRRVEDRGQALAGASTLNRLELGNSKSTRAHKIQYDADGIESAILTLGVRCLNKHSRELILDFDATDDPLHGDQEGRFFQGYYKNYCYLPLYCFIGDIPVWAELRTSDKDAADGTVEALEKIVVALRQRCPKAKLIFRGDGGFCREEIMKWCEENGVRYVIGLPKNARLLENAGRAMADARAHHVLCGGVAVRRFADFQYRTRKSWSTPRRVVAKAEVTSQGDNPRFIVTNLSAKESARFQAEALYENIYCGRGQMENMIKQQQLDLMADRTSTAYFASNQLRLWFSTLAYLLLERLRTWGLKKSPLARATVGTVRRKMLKIAAQVTVSVRRIYVRLSSNHARQSLWSECHRRLHRRLKFLGIPGD